MSSEISWINNYRLARSVTRTGAAFHCNERLLLLMKPIYEFGTYKWCPPNKMNFWESKSWCPLWGEETKPKSSQLLTLKISLFLRYVQPKAGNSCIQDHTGHDFILIERLQGWFQIYTSHRIFQWQLCFRETVSLPSTCQEKHGPSHLATISDHPPPFLTNGLTHSLCCWLKGIQLRKH